MPSASKATSWLFKMSHEKQDTLLKMTVLTMASILCKVSLVFTSISADNDGPRNSVSCSIINIMLDTERDAECNHHATSISRYLIAFCYRDQQLSVVSSSCNDCKLFQWDVS